MEESKELELVAIAPVFFQNFHADPKDSCVAFGIECDDGWYIPLMNLVKKIRVLNIACKVKNCKIVADQIKEKFGELRVYYSILTEENSTQDKDFISDIDMLITDAISVAEDECWHTCEVCGQKDGKDTPITSTEGWIKRLCGDCHKRRHEYLSSLNK